MQDLFFFVCVFLSVSNSKKYSSQALPGRLQQKLDSAAGAGLQSHSSCPKLIWSPRCCQVSSLRQMSNEDAGQLSRNVLKMSYQGACKRF
jgi:hypothetical protein